MLLPLQLNSFLKDLRNSWSPSDSCEARKIRLQCTAPAVREQGKALAYYVEVDVLGREHEQCFSA